MKNLIQIKSMHSLMFVFVFTAVLGISANVKAQQASDKVYNSVDKFPKYPGGMDEFYKFLAQHMHYPPGKKEHGRVLIEFIIEKDGTMSNFTIKREFKKGYGQAAIDALSQCPKWTPGTKNGTPVRTAFTMPVQFS